MWLNLHTVAIYHLHTRNIGLPTEVSRQLWAAGEIEELGKVMQHARLFMTLNKKEKSAAIGQQ